MPADDIADTAKRDTSKRVEQCLYRTHVRKAGDVETARCEFLEKLTGIGDAPLLEVRRDACETCCRFPEPRETRINEVHASLLYILAGRVIERGGVPGCDVGKAVGIRGWAEQNLKFDDGIDPIDFDRLARVGVAAECLHFGEQVGTRVEGRQGKTHEEVHACRHPCRGSTTIAECYTCRHWTDGFGTEPSPLRETFHRRVRVGEPKVRRWAVGVTTTRRYQPTLPYCLDSLLRAGWEEPRIFADSAVDLTGRHQSLPLSLREPRLGAWPNYYLSMVELLMREPQADAYMLVQDDAIFHDRENLREFLEEEVLWPSADTGFVSLYCSRSYARDAPGWYELDRPWVWGAVALVFPAESARRLVMDQEVFRHRWSERNDGLANIDVVIGEWARRSALKTFFPSPSLAQHIGESSTLWPRARARGSRRASNFAGERCSLGEPGQSGSQNGQAT